MIALDKVGRWVRKGFKSEFCKALVFRAHLELVLPVPRFISPRAEACLSLLKPLLTHLPTLSRAIIGKILSFPLDGAGGFAGHIVHHTVDTTHLVGDAV